ncbi:MAG: RluA family pseudouridine synthase [Erysipelotrichales bacterium]|nr:RluA family pseudouridine synthase [Erysipelotrichales bacterium]
MEIKVKDSEERIRIDKYLGAYLDDSRSLIAKMIDSEYILVNDEPTKSNYVVRTGDEITIIDGFVEPETIEPEDIPINIIYEDKDLIVVDKESGMVVHPGSGNFSGTLVNALMYHTKDLSDINGEVRPGIVHRIDKDTSGLMIVAKNNKTHEMLADALSRHEIKRDYIALIKGEFMHDTATIDAPIGRDKNDRKKMTVTADNSKAAVTHLRVLERYKGYTLVKLSLETGRTHQIRVHMNYIGYPIFNDPVYTNDNCTEFGQFLHSATLEFVHPTTKENLHFESELPAYFKDFIDTLEKK